MKKREKLLRAIAPIAIHLFFKSCKQLAEAKWQLTIPEDELAVEPAKRASIPTNGTIRLLRSPGWIKWLETAPFLTAYHDGKRHHIIFPGEEFWNLPEIQPFKAERDAWLAKQEQESRQREAVEQRQVTPTPTPQPPNTTTIAFKVTPRADSEVRPSSE